MTYDTLRKAMLVSLHKPGRSVEQAERIAGGVLWRVISAYQKAQSKAFFDVLYGLTKRDGDMVTVKGGPSKLREFGSLVEKRTLKFFPKLLRVEDRRILKKAGVTLAEVLDFLQKQK